MFEYDIAEYSQINQIFTVRIERLQAEFLKLQKWIIEEKENSNSLEGRIRQVKLEASLF